MTFVKAGGELFHPKKDKRIFLSSFAKKVAKAGAANDKNHQLADNRMINSLKAGDQLFTPD